MQLNEIKYFLDNMFTNQNEFQTINGLNNSLDAKYMLVADVLSESSEMLANIIQERLNITATPITTANITNNQSTKTSF